MDKIEALKLFNLIAQQSSFTKAADLLQRPRSSVSALIQQLENHLGARLFFRTTRTVRLTQEGKALLERSTVLLTQLEEIEQLFHPKTPLKGLLRVDLPSRVATQLLAPHLPEFLDKHPELHLELRAFDQFSDLVGDQVDCAIRFGNLEDSSLIAQLLGQCQMVNCASFAYLERYGTPLSLNDLTQHWMIGYNPNYHSAPQTERWQYVKGREVSEVLMKTQVTVTDTESYIAYALAGLGLIQVPAYDVQPHLNSGALVSVLLSFTAPPLSIYAIYPHRKHLSLKTRLFIEFFQSILKQRTKI